MKNKKKKSVLSLNKLSKKYQHSEFLVDNFEYFNMELWDKDLVDTILHLPLEDEDLFNLCEAIDGQMEMSWNEGYDEAYDRLTLPRKPSYTARLAVTDLDN